jgi:hypothetical protein
MTYLKVQVDELVPAVLIGIIEFVLPIDPTNIGPVGIDRTTLAGFTVVPAGAIAPIQVSGFVRQMDILAT